MTFLFLPHGPCPLSDPWNSGPPRHMPVPLHALGLESSPVLSRILASFSSVFCSLGYFLSCLSPTWALHVFCGHPLLGVCSFGELRGSSCGMALSLLLEKCNQRQILTLLSALS